MPLRETYPPSGPPGRLHAKLVSDTNTWNCWCFPRSTTTMLGITVMPGPVTFEVFSPHAPASKAMAMHETTVRRRMALSSSPESGRALRLSLGGSSAQPDSSAPAPVLECQRRPLDQVPGGHGERQRRRQRGEHEHRLRDPRVREHD